MLSTDTIVYCVATIASIFLTGSLTNYRIQQLEKKVEKHNCVVERMALAEKDIKVLYHEVNEIQSDLKK